MTIILSNQLHFTLKKQLERSFEINFKSLLSTQTKAQSETFYMCHLFHTGLVQIFLQNTSTVLQIWQGKLLRVRENAWKRRLIYIVFCLNALPIIRPCFCDGLTVRQTTNVLGKNEPKRRRRQQDWGKISRYIYNKFLILLFRVF